MFFNLNQLQPTQSKKIIYLIAWMLLGILLSLLIYVFIEIRYFNWAQNNQLAEESPRAVALYAGTVLHPVLLVGFLIAGALFGFWQGKVWWRKIYIEQYWYKKFTRS